MISALEREAPRAIEDEEALLSCCLLDGNESISKAISIGVTPLTFFGPANRCIFACLQEMLSAGAPIDLESLASELRATRKLEEAGGYTNLVAVSGRVPTTAHISFFASRILEAAKLREMIHRASSLLAACHEYEGGGLAAALGSRLESMTMLLHDGPTERKWSQAVDEAEALTRERMKPLHQRATAEFEVPWGFVDLDRAFMAFEQGELVVLAARPSVGKSSLMRQIVYKAAQGGLPTLVESLEVTDVEAAINFAANITSIPSRRALNELSTGDQAHLLTGFQKLRTIPHFALHEDRSWLACKARAKAFKASHGLRLMTVDFLQLLDECKIPMRGETIAQAIGRVTSDMKQFAKAERLVLIVLSQVNRKTETDNRRPVLADLRDSGTIEENANRVIFLHRPPEYMLGPMKVSQSGTSTISDNPKFYIEAIQSKGRNQGTGEVALSFDRATASFRMIS